MKYTVNKSNVAWRILDEEAVIIHKQTGFYYSLNRTGTYLWDLLLEKELGINDIVSSLASYYHKDGTEISDDIRSLLGDLVKEKLIQET